jgi:hypothetical protein
MEIALVALLLHGMAISTNSRDESVSQRAMTGIPAYEASIMAWRSDLGSVTIISLGSLNFLVFWLVKVPGVHLAEVVDKAWVYFENLTTARWPYGLAETAYITRWWDDVEMEEIRYDNVFWVVDGRNNSGSEFDLLPGFLNVEDVDAIVATVWDVFLHGVVKIFGTMVNLDVEEWGEMRFRRVKDGGLPRWRWVWGYPLLSELVHDLETLKPFPVF